MPSSTEIEIPQKALPDLKKIASLGEEHFNSLLLAISEAEPCLTTGQFAKNIAEKVPLIQPSDIRSVLGTTFILYSVRIKSGMSLSPQALAEGIANSPLVVKDKEFSLEKRKILSDRLTRLLGYDKSIGVTSKAFDVMTENERIFCGARILSDIRPVFADKPETAEAAVIIHNLQIGFHQMGEHKEFYVSLDTDDVQKLKQVIERAEQKTAALQSILSKSDIPYLGV